MLHYYFSEDLDAAIPVRLVALDEALSIVEYGVEPSCRPPGAITRPASEGIGSYLSSLRRLCIEPAAEEPPLPSLDGLRRRGIPVLAATEFRQAIEPHRFRRRIALSLVEDSGRSWRDVLEGAGAPRGRDEPAEPPGASPH